MEEVFPDIPPIKTNTGPNGVTKNRRADVWVQENTNIELKGSSRDTGRYSMSKSDELEFLNDAIYFSRGGQDFQWHIARQLDITEAQTKMKTLLGGDSFPGGIDSRLLAYIEDIPDQNAQELMLDALKQLRDKLDAGEIIKQAEYID